MSLRSIRRTSDEGDARSYANTCDECGAILEGASYDHDPACSEFPVTPGSPDWSSASPEFRWSDLELTRHEPQDGVCQRCKLRWPCPWKRTFDTAYGSLLVYSASWRDRLKTYLALDEPESEAMKALRVPFRRAGGY